MICYIWGHFTITKVELFERCDNKGSILACIFVVLLITVFLIKLGDTSINQDIKKLSEVHMIVKIFIMKSTLSYWEGPWPCFCNHNFFLFHSVRIVLGQCALKDFPFQTYSKTPIFWPYFKQNKEIWCTTNDKIFRLNFVYFPRHV